MTKIDNPLEWYERKFCNQCKNKPCQGRMGGVYKDNWNAKLFCSISAGLMAELDRSLIKELKRKK